MEKINILKAIPNFPFLESTIDGLSYYQLLAGLNAYIDKVVDNLNSIGGTNEQYLELKEKVDNINALLGDESLSTDSKTIISAINELSDTIKNIESTTGNLNELKTTNKNSLVGAINEIIINLSTLITLQENLTIQTYGKLALVSLNNFNVPSTQDITIVLPEELKPAYNASTVITNYNGSATGTMFISAPTSLLYIRVATFIGQYRGQLLYVLE